MSGPAPAAAIGFPCNEGSRYLPLWIAAEGADIGRGGFSPELSPPLCRDKAPTVAGLPLPIPEPAGAVRRDNKIDPPAAAARAAEPARPLRHRKIGVVTLGRLGGIEIDPAPAVVASATGACLPKVRPAPSFRFGQPQVGCRNREQQFLRYRAVLHLRRLRPGFLGSIAPERDHRVAVCRPGLFKGAHCASSCELSRSFIEGLPASGHGQTPTILISFPSGSCINVLGTRLAGPGNVSTWGNSVDGASMSVLDNRRD